MGISVYNDKEKMFLHFCSKSGLQVSVPTKILLAENHNNINEIILETCKECSADINTESAYMINFKE